MKEFRIEEKDKNDINTSINMFYPQHKSWKTLWSWRNYKEGVAGYDCGVDVYFPDIEEAKVFLDRAKNKVPKKYHY